MKTLPDQISLLRSQIAEMKGAIAALENPLPAEIAIVETAPLAFLKQQIAKEAAHTSREQAIAHKLAQAREALSHSESRLADLEKLESKHRKAADAGWAKLSKRGEAFHERVLKFIEATQADLDEMESIAAKFSDSEAQIYGTEIGLNTSRRPKRTYSKGQFYEPQWRSSLPVATISHDLRQVTIGRWEIHRHDGMQRRERLQVVEAPNEPDEQLRDFPA